MKSLVKLTKRRLLLSKSVRGRFLRLKRLPEKQLRLGKTGFALVNSLMRRRTPGSPTLGKLVTTSVS